jgi:hypothetical protein
MRMLAALLLFLRAGFGIASVPLQASLDDLARGADHILVGRVVGVDMIDAEGRQRHDDADRTGPGLGNTIRLRVQVDEVLVTNAARVPDELLVPLDPFMHYSLGQIREAHARPSEPLLFLLRGDSFSPIVAGVFSRALADRDEALRIHAASHR